MRAVPSVVGRWFSDFFQWIAAAAKFRFAALAVAAFGHMNLQLTVHASIHITDLR